MIKQLAFYNGADFGMLAFSQKDENPTYLQPGEMQDHAEESLVSPKPKASQTWRLNVLYEHTKNMHILNA